MIELLVRIGDGAIIAKVAEEDADDMQTEAAQILVQVMKATMSYYVELRQRAGVPYGKALQEYWSPPTKCTGGQCEPDGLADLIRGVKF